MHRRRHQLTTALASPRRCQLRQLHGAEYPSRCPEHALKLPRGPAAGPPMHDCTWPQNVAGCTVTAANLLSLSERDRRHSMAKHGSGSDSLALVAHMVSRIWACTGAQQCSDCLCVSVLGCEVQRSALVLQDKHKGRHWRRIEAPVFALAHAMVALSITSRDPNLARGRPP